MAKAEASTLIDAPVEAVWVVIRNFNGLPAWNPRCVKSEIEGGRPADAIGCIRALHRRDGTYLRERLLMLDDCRYRFSYNFETPAFLVENYHATIELLPLTQSDRTFIRWSATFDEAPADKGKYVDIISNAIFATGLATLAGATKGRRAPAGAVRWLGLRPAKAFRSAVLHAPIEQVWPKLREFDGIARWNPDIKQMRLLDGAKPDQVSAVREFVVGDARISEQLTGLNDIEHSVRYKINASPESWLNCHATLKLYSITATKETLAVWMADWDADARDDLTLVPIMEKSFQRALDMFERQNCPAATE